ncbi:BrnT family toxin [Duganella callida]|uniref:BrnT family toxin n=1 Tax=Duganella callida TaxID=2561932 RepID=A0A4Y9SQ53_9BURK|nr:BrnT family toxin [Duganella callida]TFW28711.1 BrnT family toxin [Duganella callida]
MTIYTWDEAKRKTNLRKHGLDFADAPEVLEDSRSYSTEDTRYHYSERRFLTVGFSQGKEVAVIYAEQQNGIRIISFRKASRIERRVLLGA